MTTPGGGLSLRRRFRIIRAELSGGGGNAREEETIADTLGLDYSGGWKKDIMGPREREAVERRHRLFESPLT